MLVIDDASPHGGEWKEDTDNREDMSDNLGKGIQELKTRKDSWKTC